MALGPPGTTLRDQKGHVRRCERAYDRAIRNEESADTEVQAWRLTKVSERCLRDLQAVRDGQPLPERRIPRTARNLARLGMAALGLIGRAIARAMSALNGLKKARAALAARKDNAVGNDQKEDSTVKTLKTTALKFQTVNAFARRYNRVPERMTVVSATFTAPVTASIEDLIEMAHANGLSRGDRTLAGVFELQTDQGIWSCPDDSKLLMRTGCGLSLKARFRSWETLEAAESTEVA